MRVRILSGNQAGEIQEVGEVEGEHMIHFGFAEAAGPAAVLEPAVDPPATAPKALEAPRSVRRGSGLAGPSTESP